MRTDLPPLWPDDPRSAWEPYEPTAPWDQTRVAHLYRRAGFAATSSQMARGVELGYQGSIRLLLEGDATGPDGRSRSEFEEVYGSMADSARRDPSIGRVRLAWLFRLLHSPHPLQERMTLAWHGHYATRASKVADPVAVLDQIEAFRTLWDAPISRLHWAALDSSAMQVWLDGLDSDKSGPNENLGREFLELFALGDGAYDEADVKAAARSLTGYRLGERSDFRAKPVVFDPRRHDDGSKTLLGETGPWGPADLVRIASKHPASAVWVARRLFLTLVDDLAPPPAPLVEALADLIRTSGDVDVVKGIRVVLGSRLCQAESTRGRKVKSPVDFAVGLVRSSGWYRPTPDSALVDIQLMHMGQTLFDPPSVAGWPGGLSWLGAPLLIARANFVAAITARTGVEGRLGELARKQQSGSPSAWAKTIRASFSPDISGKNDRQTQPPAGYADAVRLVASFPEAHLA